MPSQTLALILAAGDQQLTVLIPRDLRHRTGVFERRADGLSGGGVPDSRRVFVPLAVTSFRLSGLKTASLTPAPPCILSTSGLPVATSSTRVV